MNRLLTTWWSLKSPAVYSLRVYRYALGLCRFCLDQAECGRLPALAAMRAQSLSFSLRRTSTVICHGVPRPIVTNNLEDLPCQRLHAGPSPAR